MKNMPIDFSSPVFHSTRPLLGQTPPSKPKIVQLTELSVTLNTLSIPLRQFGQ